MEEDHGIEVTDLYVVGGRRGPQQAQVAVYSDLTPKRWARLLYRLHVRPNFVRKRAFSRPDRLLWTSEWVNIDEDGWTKIPFSKPLSAKSWVISRTR